MKNIKKSLNSTEFYKNVRNFTSDFILFLRKSKCVNQKSVANILGISIQQLMKYEKGINTISLTKLLLLCNYLEYDIQDFIKELLVKTNLNNAESKYQDMKFFENTTKLTPGEYKIINRFINDLTNSN